MPGLGTSVVQQEVHAGRRRIALGLLGIAVLLALARPWLPMITSAIITGTATRNRHRR